MGDPQDSCLPSSNSQTLSIDAELWLLAERRAQEILYVIQPALVSDRSRNEIIGFVQRLINHNYGVEACLFGSVPLKTYLPDGDIDLTVFSHHIEEEKLACDIYNYLRKEEARYTDFEIMDVQYVRAQVKLVKCTIRNIAVDISFNQISGLSALCFLEKVDQVIGKDHLFKHSIILIKAWCYYESRILGAHHGLIATYTLEALVLYIINRFHSTLCGPLAVLYRFLEHFSTFDWDNYCVTINGPVALSRLPNITAEESDGDDLLLSHEFLRQCREVFSVPMRNDGTSHVFPVKFMNIVDPLKEDNNLGRSVSKGNFHRIRCALSYGVQRLRRILLRPSENMGVKLEKFFGNTLDRNGKGQRPDILVPVPAFGTGRSEASNLIGDYDNYFNWLTHGRWCQNYTLPFVVQSGPPISFQSAPPIPFQSGLPITIQSSMSVPFQPGLPITVHSGSPLSVQSGLPVSALSGLPVTVQSGLPVTLQSDLSLLAHSGRLLTSRIQSWEMWDNMHRDTERFIPEHSYNNSYASQVFSAPYICNQNRRSRGTGTYIPTMTPLTGLDRYQSASYRDRFDSPYRDRYVSATHTERYESGTYRDTREISTSRDTRETGTYRDTREISTSRDTRETGTSRDTRETGTSRDTRESGTSRDARESGASRDARESGASQDARESGASRDARESGASRDARVSSASKDARESSASKDALESSASKDARESFASKDTRESFASKDTRESVASKDARESVASKDARESVASKDALESVASKDARESVASKDARESGASKDARESGASKDARESGASKDARESGASRVTRESGASRDTRESGASKDTRESGASRDTRSRDTRESGLSKDMRESSASRVTRESGASRVTRESGASRDTRESGASRDTRKSGAFRDRREGGAFRDRRESGVSRDMHNISTVSDRKGRASYRSRHENSIEPRPSGQVPKPSSLPEKVEDVSETDKGRMGDSFELSMEEFPQLPGIKETTPPKLDKLDWTTLPMKDLSLPLTGEEFESYNISTSSPTKPAYSCDSSSLHPEDSEETTVCEEAYELKDNKDFPCLSI